MAPDSIKTPLFLTAEDKLEGDDAVAAILILDDGRYVMQLRDPIARIFYPDHWGCFGGAVNEGETAVDALHRELNEELGVVISKPQEFSRFDFDIKFWRKKVYRIYYEVRVADDFLSSVTLREGADVRAFEATEVLQQPRVTPYDAFAIWLHFKSARFS